METQVLRESLMELARNYRWTWRASHRRLLQSLPGAAGSSHPVQTVRALTDDQIGELAGDQQFVGVVAEEIEDLRGLATGGPPTIAYCSMEFGISSTFHQYAGGLGVLAGDHLKAASDSGLPLVGVGLFYRFGAFRQEIVGGRQVEKNLPAFPDDVGAVDTGLVIEVPLAGRDVLVRVLRIAVGAVTLILLDTHVDGNSEADRDITDSLYMGSAEKRVAQEMVLGVGGARALAALGYEIDLFHLNEGHAGFVSLELIDRVIQGDLSEAVARVRDGVVFTTHTPVPAGIDRLSPDVLRPHLEGWAQRWGVDVERVWDLGSDPANGDEFNMAIFCLRMSRIANGVSELHGEVSRELFSQVPEGRVITHVTNGVHARTWAGSHVQDLFDIALGPGWDQGEPEAWNRVTGIDDDALVDVRRHGSVHLADYLADHGVDIDPDAMVVGFARRFAPYKRSTLILRESDRLARLLADDERPTHLLFAGKSHPANQEGMALIEQILGFSDSKAARGRFSFVPDYGMEVSAAMVQGCDIWLNNPIRLHEASGTSGEKVALNGGLNLSILDGWWAEMYDGDNGWAIASSSADDPQVRDIEEASALMDVLEAARDEYFDDRARLIKRIRHAWLTLGPRVTAARMLADYRERIYLV
ncbi:MAG TPA: alpha-glucan family phosphorylase [Acidimicrobiia bacterium]|nr:alpha-glucan family phosphorylase [Acidimicrobiia bacterium]